MLFVQLLCLQVLFCIWCFAFGFCNGCRLKVAKAQEVLTVVKAQDVLTVVKAKEVLTVVKAQEVLAVVGAQEVLKDEKPKKS